MKKVIGNYLTQANNGFPLDCETLDYIQTNGAMLQILGNLAGDKAILSGCALEQNNSRRAEGYVFLKTTDFPEGEVLFWEGGDISSGMYIKLEDVSVTAQGYEYSKAYTRRSLSPGIGTESYSWTGFKDIQSVIQLADKNTEQDTAIAAIAPLPLGVVQMWAGNTVAGSFPDDYKYCDGSQLATADYPKLYAIIGRLHTPTNVPSGYFCLPDLRSRFIVGYNPGDTDYDAIAKTGGNKTVTLELSQMPKHSHDVDDYYFIEDSVSGYGISGDEYVGPGRMGSGRTDFNNNTLLYKTHASENVGGDQAHENRPPYYTLAYIMRVK